MKQDQELEAMGAILASLQDIEKEAQIRILSWVQDRLGLRPLAVLPTISASESATDAGPTAQPERRFQSFSDLYEATLPGPEKDRAIVSGYWHQVCLGQQEFMAQPVSAELKNMGHPISNITETLTRLMTERPALILQTSKSGSSRQARKTYRLTQAGIKRVEQLMLAARQGEDQ